jgi:ABC-type sugar transport system ATPase subunit
LRSGEVLAITVWRSGKTELGQALFGAWPPIEAKYAGLMPPGVSLRQRRGCRSAVPEDRKAEGLLFDEPVRRNVTWRLWHLVKRWGVIDRSRATNGSGRPSIVHQSLLSAPAYPQRGNQQKTVLAMVGDRRARLDFAGAHARDRCRRES